MLKENWQRNAGRNWLETTLTFVKERFNPFVLIALVTGAHLCRNPRVVKEASALAGAGYEVKVLGPVFLEELGAVDEGLARAGGFERVVTADLRFKYRLGRKVAMEMVRRFGVQHCGALGYGLGTTLARGRDLKADLYIGHQEVGAWVCRELGQEGLRVGADIEDWYSRDLLPEAQRGRPVRLLEDCEGWLLKHGRHVTTTSKAMAGALAGAYNAPEPKVIYNAFPWSDRERMDGLVKDRSDRSRVSVHWVSQVTGEGRGFDTLFKALEEIKTPLDIHLRGSVTETTRRRIEGRLGAGQGHRLFFHELVHPKELLSRIAEHDIGLALEMATPENKNLTVSNKILHYLLGGLAVVATDTAGQREIAERSGGAVTLCVNESSQALAAALKQLVNDPDRLRATKKAALEAAQEKFSWERQVSVLLEGVVAATGK